MLKNISPIISPMLLKVLCEMGHGDEIVIADGGFPAESIGKNNMVIRADGIGTAEDDDKVDKIRAVNAGGTRNIVDACKHSN